jgi:hypothetical protein
MVLRSQLTPVFCRPNQRWDNQNFGEIFAGFKRLNASAFKKMHYDYKALALFN